MYESLARSLESTKNPFNSTEDVIAWIGRRNREVEVKVTEMPFAQLRGWHFDGRTGNLVHDSGRFFSVVGLDVTTNTGKVVHWMQPIINQPEVGYLGIIAREFNGVLYFLLQAKIEPGNVNCVQLSPTIQATRSNYTCVHGGRRPAYLDFFKNARPEQILLDQLQSEQGSRFYRKRNRNIIIRVKEDIPVYDDFCWLTLGQIKELLRRDNLVNMDTRTVISGLRADEFLVENDYSVMSVDDVLHRMSELKSRYELIVDKVPLKDVTGWTITPNEIVREDRLFFRVLGVDVMIANREVARWCQPIVQSMHEDLCVLFRKRVHGVMHYLLQAKVECGNFDVVELAPTIQCMTGPYKTPIGYVPVFLQEFLSGEIRGRAVFDTMQSEEGGRFYHEQNRNVVFELDEDVEIPSHDNFLWLTMPQIKEFLRFNNYLNIQVRSLISAL